MNLNEYSTKSLVEELERRGFNSIFVNPNDKYKIDITPQPNNVGDYIEGQGAETILFIND